MATRWVLQRPETASVIVGTRLCVSTNAEANLQVFTFKHGPDELVLIEEAAVRAGGRRLGDCTRRLALVARSTGR